jgi:hypothetical protein
MSKDEAMEPIFNEMQLDALKELGNIGASHASTALTTLIKKDVMIDVPECYVCKVEKLPEAFGDMNQRVVGVYFDTVGEKNGHIIMILPEEMSLVLTDLITGTEHIGGRDFTNDDMEMAAEIGNILDFHRRYRNSMRITLDRNRRSRPGIIKAAGAFASTIAPRLEKTMQAHRPRGGPEVVRWVAETPQDEAERIAETIAALHAGGFRYRDVAVLYRSLRTSAPPLVQALRARGIPLTCAGRAGLFLQPEIRVLARTYAWICDREWQDEKYGESSPVEIEDLVREYREAFPGASRFRNLSAYLEGWKAAADDARRPVNLVGDF